MPQSNLIELTYFDPKANIRLITYADTIITEPDRMRESIAAVRFGGTLQGLSVPDAAGQRSSKLEDICSVYNSDTEHDAQHLIMAFRVLGETG